MLIVSGELDHTVPPVLSKAAYKKQSRNENVTEFLEFEGRGHALTIDSGWREVAERTLGFVQRFV
jgi:esterase/lipase